MKRFRRRAGLMLLNTGIRATNETALVRWRLPSGKCQRKCQSPDSHHGTGWFIPLGTDWNHERGDPTWERQRWLDRLAKKNNFLKIFEETSFKASIEIMCSMHKQRKLSIPPGNGMYVWDMEGWTWDGMEHKKEENETSKIYFLKLWWRLQGVGLNWKKNMSYSNQWTTVFHFWKQTNGQNRWKSHPILEFHIKT